MSPLYKNLPFVFGVALLILGTGNWITGAGRARPYLHYLQRHPGRAESSRSLKAELLEPPDDERQERDVTRAKLEFYQVVQSGGRFMVLVGFASMLAGWIRQRRAVPVTGRRDAD